MLWAKVIAGEARKRDYRAREMDVEISATNDLSAPWGLLRLVFHGSGVCLACMRASYAALLYLEPHSTT